MVSEATSWSMCSAMLCESTDDSEKVGIASWFRRDSFYIPQRAKEHAVRLIHKWLEVWIDDCSVEYVLLVVETQEGEVQIVDPQEKLKIIEKFSEYEEAVLWLREDEYRKVEGRLNNDQLRYQFTTDEAWQQLLRQEPRDPMLLSQILASIDAFSVAKVNELYERLIDDPHWHPQILSSMFANRLGYFIETDRVAVKTLLSRLNVPQDSWELAFLMRMLGTDAQNDTVPYCSTIDVLLAATDSPNRHRDAAPNPATRPSPPR